MSVTRNRVGLMHDLTVLHNWATDENRDTISALTEAQATELRTKIKELWAIIERRGGK